MKEEEYKEYKELESLIIKQGFLTDSQQERWDILCAKRRMILKKKLQDLDKILDEKRLMRLN